MTDRYYISTPRPAIAHAQVSLHSSWSDALGGMSIAVSEQEERGPVTTPYGRLVDQATLLGVLNGLHDSLHMLLLSMECLSIEASDANPDEGTSALLS